MKILFVIPTLFYNPVQTKECVNSLLSSLKNTEYEYSIWVIANTENQAFNEWIPPINVNKDCSNLKYNISKAINLGISREANYDYFCYIDEGIRLSSKWLEFILSIYNKYNNIGVIGIRPHSTFNYYHIELEKSIYEVLWTDGIMFTGSDRINNTGKFDELYFADCEMQDYCYRLMNNGYRNLYVNTPLIKHILVPWTLKSYSTDELMSRVNKSRELRHTRWGKWEISKHMKDKI